jgi:LacI family transcriptional regulator
MPRVKCSKCEKTETVLRSGFVRGKQRFYCKECSFHFTLHHEGKKISGRKIVHQTTIIDIAKAIGVSNSTVSRALRNHADISYETKEAIKALAVKMDYQPNLFAQSFAKKQTNTIGVIIPNLETTFFSIMLSGIQNVANKYGYKVMICQSNESHKAEVENIQALMRNWIDGLLICHSIETDSFEHVKLHMNKGIPIVHFHRVSMDTDTSKVMAEDVKGAEEITDHLAGQGCKRIAIIVGSNHLLITKKKLDGYKKSLEKNGLRFNEDLVAYTDFTHQSVITAVDNWLTIRERPDAIFSISDKCAIFTMRHLKQLKIKIPQEICVAGFGNDPMGEVIEPGLTTFNPNTLRIGETAAELFFEQILSGDNFKPKTKIIKGNLIIRGSTVRIHASRPL